MIPSLPAPLSVNSVLLSAKFEFLLTPLWSLKTALLVGIALTDIGCSLIPKQQLHFVALGIVVEGKEFLFGICA